MKTRNYLSFLAAAVLALSATGCASEDAAQDKKNNGNEPDTRGLTEFVTGDAPATRTSLTHTTVGGGCNYFWENNDKIYVIDDDGTKQASNALASTTQAANAKFYLPGKYNNTNKYKVRYTGTAGTADKVTIAATQSQSAGNNTAHLGASGDCGVAEANRNGGRFDFQLEHKAAYLCFLPRTTSSVLGACQLRKIQVISNNDIAGTYDFNDNGLNLTTPTGTSKTITLTCGSGFALTTTTSDINTTNTCYMVIAPGTHTLTVKYWVYDPITGIQGTITKPIASRPYNENTITDLTANLDVRNYPSDDYYMWDAADNQHYWAGHISEQPKTNYNSGDPTPTGYPQNNTDSRWYNETSFPVSASGSCKDCPNVNECLWYAEKGDPHWDDIMIWATLGHLHKGGMWIKKRNHITGFSAAVAPDGTDYTTSTTVAYSAGAPSIPYISTSPLSNPTEYFYLPTLGSYNGGALSHMYLHPIGFYWSSTAAPMDIDLKPVAYNLYVGKAFISVHRDYRSDGVRRWTTDGANLPQP